MRRYDSQPQSFLSRFFFRLLGRWLGGILFILLSAVYLYSLHQHQGFLTTLGDAIVHPLQWINPVKDVLDTPREPFAMKVMERFSKDAPFTPSVQIVDGKRWRVEKRDPSFAVEVAICDGTNVVCNISGTSAARMDPTHFLYSALVLGRGYKDASALMKPLSENCDGHDCWKVIAKIQGIPFEVWIDKQSGLPVSLIGSGNSQYREVHYSRIPIDFTNPRTEEFFDTTHLQPFFTRFL